MFDQGGFPQAELRPGRLPTMRITTREPTHKQNYVPPGSWLAGWLAGALAGWPAEGLAGWLAESQRVPERPREAWRGGAWIEQACHALG